MRALITGITGQDGVYLAQSLLARGASVVGALRQGAAAADSARAELIAAGLGAAEAAAIEPLPVNIEDQDSVETLVVQARPDVIFHLAAQSSVAVAWQEPVLTARVNGLGTVHFLEALRRRAPAARFILAGSCDCYDHEAAGEGGLTPETPFKATNPYAVSKVMAHQMTVCYRREFGLRAAVAVLFNHTSPRRHERFVERGIIRQAVRVSLGLADAVTVGSLETRRDWSWAPELMDGLARMGELAEPVDLVLAGGRTLTVGDWVRESFAQLGLDPARHLRVDPGRLHGGDRPNTFGNLERTRAVLGWAPRMTLAEMVRALIAADREFFSGVRATKQ